VTLPLSSVLPFHSAAAGFDERFTEREAVRNREWWGENLLGKALADVRERLREGGN
jgi:predicted NAD-dependent protein-ADP-ribosyltransferase YbiA (DUF1768 family)